MHGRIIPNPTFIMHFIKCFVICVYRELIRYRIHDFIQQTIGYNNIKHGTRSKGFICIFVNFTLSKQLNLFCVCGELLNYLAISFLQHTARQVRPSQITEHFTQDVVVNTQTQCRSPFCLLLSVSHNITIYRVSLTCPNH